MRSFFRYLIVLSLSAIISQTFLSPVFALEKGTCSKYYGLSNGDSECCMWKDVPDPKVWGLNSQIVFTNPSRTYCGGMPTENWGCYCQILKSEDAVVTTENGERKEVIKETAPLKYTPQVSIPGEGSPFTAGKTVTVPANTKLLADYIIAIFKYSTGIIGIIAAIVIMMGGVRWLTAAGGAAVGEAKTMIISGLSGLLLALGSFLLLSTINTSLVNFTIQPVSQVTKIDLFEYGCCEKWDLANVLTTDNLKDIECRTLKGYKFTVFRYGYKAEANKCVADSKKQACCLYGWYKEDTFLNDDGPNKCMSQLMASGDALNNFRASCTAEVKKLDADDYNIEKIQIQEGKKCQEGISLCE